MTREVPYCTAPMTVSSTPLVMRLQERWRHRSGVYGQPHREVTPISNVLGLWAERELEVAHGVAASRQKRALLSTWTEILAWFSLGAQASRLLRKAAKMAAFPGYKLQEHNGINIMSGYL